MVALLAEMSAHGLSVRDNVAGDPGCGQPSLRDNASRLTIQLAGEPAAYTVFLFRWRRPADFDAAAADFGACVAEFSQVGTAVSTLEHSPWRAFGPNWSAALEAALDDSLAGAAGGSQAD